MEKRSRTFKLRLSPAGMDVLIAAHCRLIHATRQLLPWGTTLHAALAHLDTVPPDQILIGLDRIAGASLVGSEVHFLGAPAALNDIAARIATRVLAASPAGRRPPLLQLYVLALDVLASAEPPSLQRALSDAGGSSRPTAARAKESRPPEPRSLQDRER